MTRDEWIRLYDELWEVYLGQRDILTVSLSLRESARAIGLLSRDRNGNTTLSRKAAKLFVGKL